MKTYPKVWRHDHPLIEDLLDEGSIHLVEKLDGSNFRFTLYEERFSQFYEEFDGVQPADGDVVFGSKNRWRGTINDDPDTFDGNFNRAVQHLNESLNTDALSRLHTEYDCPLVFFAENMVLHSLDYNWDSVPPLVGFDVYAPCAVVNTEDPFSGFLSLEAVVEAFTEIGLTPAPVHTQDGDEFSPIPAEDFSPETVEVPESHWRAGKAEGLVIRNDDVGERGKLVTEEFREKNAQRWGKRKSDATDDTELLVATYCTNARIRKNIHKMIQDEGYEFSKSIIEPLYKRVVRDIWEEEWADIIQQDWTIEMRRVWPLCAKRCATVVEVMETNADLNNVSPDRLWEDIAE